jgi:hypothetical protein
MLAKQKDVSFKDALKEIFVNNNGFDKYLEAIPKEKLPYEGKIKPLRRRSEPRTNIPPA